MGSVKKPLHLKHRQQLIPIADVISELKPFTCGIPFLFINDLSLYINVSAEMYADDTTLYDIQESLYDIE